VKKLSTLAYELCHQIEGLPLGEQQTQVIISASILMGLIEAEEKKTDDDKIRAILAPYLDEMTTLDKRFLSDLSFSVEYRDENLSTRINAWLFSGRHEAATLAEMMQTFRTWDPVARERERKLAKIEAIKAELAKLESEGGAK